MLFLVFDTFFFISTGLSRYEPGSFPCIQQSAKFNHTLQQQKMFRLFRHNLETNCNWYIDNSYKKYCAGILNSRVMWWYFKARSKIKMDYLLPVFKHTVFIHRNWIPLKIDQFISFRLTLPFCTDINWLTCWYIFVNMFKHIKVIDLNIRGLFASVRNYKKTEPIVCLRKERIDWVVRGFHQVRLLVKTYLMNWLTIRGWPNTSGILNNLIIVQKSGALIVGWLWWEMFMPKTRPSGVLNMVALHGILWTIER